MAARDGFLIAALNPKILIFFTALFSQFVGTESSFFEKLYLAAIAGGIDAIWYILVAIVISSVTPSLRLKNLSIWLDKIFGLFFVAIALLFVVELFSH
jgi:threonine/homoserine/homoserine lactone efflux protein